MFPTRNQLMVTRKKKKKVFGYHCRHGPLSGATALTGVRTGHPLDCSTGTGVLVLSCPECSKELGRWPLVKNCALVQGKLHGLPVPQRAEYDIGPREFSHFARPNLKCSFPHCPSEIPPPHVFSTRWEVLDVLRMTLVFALGFWTAPTTGLAPRSSAPLSRRRSEPGKLAEVVCGDRNDRSVSKCDANHSASGDHFAVAHPR